MDHHGFLWIVLRIDQPCVARARGRNRVARSSRPRFWHLLFCYQRGDTSRQPDYRGAVETLRCANSLLFLRGPGGRVRCAAAGLETAESLILTRVASSEEKPDQDLGAERCAAVQHDIPQVSGARRNKHLMPLIEGGHEGGHEKGNTRPSRGPSGSIGHRQGCTPGAEKQPAEDGVTGYVPGFPQQVMPDHKHEGIDVAEQVRYYRVENATRVSRREQVC